MKTLKITRAAVAFAAVGAFTWSAAAMADQRAESDATEAAVAEMKALDTDGDGKLSSEEYAAGARKTFQAMDANGDGKVTAAEMRSTQERASGRKKMGKAEGDLSAAQKIRVIDSNADGVLTEAEQATASRRTFEALDTDGDGFVSESEVAAGQAKLERRARR